MSPLFYAKHSVVVPNFAEKYKQNNQLKIQQTNTPNKTIVSIIGENGLHILS
jgi:hypothetical protein